MATSNRAPIAVPPDSVRVWWGFCRDGLERDTFFEKLGSIFIPGTVQIQGPVGLTAYLPSVLPRDNEPAAPDEIALVFYEYQDAYDEAKETVGGRAYSDMHALVFDLQRSRSGFPSRFDGTLEPGGRYHLFDEPIDWQHGLVGVFVGLRRDSDDTEAFLNHVAQWAEEVQNRGDGPDGAIVTISSDFVIYWEHWPSEVDAQRTQMADLANLAEPVYRQPIETYPLPEELWDRYSGVEVDGGESFNFQFRRRHESS